MNKIECGDCPLVDIDVYGSCYQYCEKMKARKESDYQQGKADAIDEIKHQMISLHTNAIFRYGADIIEAKCDAFDELKEWLKEQSN